MNARRTVRVVKGLHVDDGEGRPLCGADGGTQDRHHGAGEITCRDCLERLGITPITRSELAAASKAVGLPVPQRTGPLPPEIVSELERRRQQRRQAVAARLGLRPAPPRGRPRRPQGKIIRFPGKA